MFKCNFSKIKGFKCGEKGRMFWKWQIQCRYSALGVFLSFFFLLYACFFVFKKKTMLISAAGMEKPAVVLP